MAMNRISLKFRKMAWGAGIISALVLAAHFLLPLVVNTSALRTRIVSQAAQRVGAEVDFQVLKPALLPLPHAVVIQGQIHRPGMFIIRFAKGVVYPQYWPLLCGLLKIGRLKILDPDIVIQEAPEYFQSSEQSKEESMLLMGRRIFEALTKAAVKLSPLAVRVKGGRLTLSRSTQSDIIFTGIRLKMDLETRGLRTVHCGFQVHTPQVVIRNGMRRLTVRNIYLKGDGRLTTKQFQISVQQLRVAAPAFASSGTAIWPAANRHTWIPAEVRLKAIDLDISPIRTAALELAGDARSVTDLFQIVRGGRVPELNVEISDRPAVRSKAAPEVRLHGRLSGGRIVLPHDLLRLEQVSGRVVLEHGRLVAKNVNARLGNSFAHDGSLELGLLDGTRVFNLDTAIDADLSELPATLERVSSSRKVTSWLDRLPPVSGRASGRLWLGDNLDRIAAKVSASGRLNTLDATLDVSGTVAVPFSEDPVFGLSVDGPLGPRSLTWLEGLGCVSSDWMLKTPITISRTRIQLDHSGGFDLDGRFASVGGLQVKAMLRIKPDHMLMGKLHLKDAASDAVIDYQGTGEGRKWQAGFTGNLEKSTVDKLLDRNNLILGRLNGNLKIRFQAGTPEYDAIQGRLDFRQINSPSIFPLPLRQLSGIVAGNGQHVDLLSVRFNWLDNTAQLSGNGTLTSEALNLDLTLSTDSLEADRLIQLFDASKRTSEPKAPDKGEALPIRGKVRVDAGRMTWKDYSFAPIKARVTLIEDQIVADLLEARVCGINIPGQIRFSQGRAQMTLRPHAADAPLQDVDQCLERISVTERLEGTLGVDGSIESNGQSDEELLRNLKGKLEVQISHGRVYNVGAAGFFTNLLSFLSVNQLIEGGLPDLRRNDFQYKSLTSKLTLEDRVLHIEESALKSNSVNIVASGDFHIADQKLNLVLLVSPLTTVDWIIERIPLLGNILQGTLVAVPVGVKGPVVNPTVVPLSPAAVGSRLGGILKRTIKTPFRILSPLLKDNSSKDQGKYLSKSSSAV